MGGGGGPKYFSDLFRPQFSEYSQCDQTFSAVITKRGAEILPNWIFFTEHAQIPRF